MNQSSLYEWSRGGSGWGGSGWGKGGSGKFWGCSGWFLVVLGSFGCGRGGSGWFCEYDDNLLEVLPCPRSADRYYTLTVTVA